MKIQEFGEQGSNTVLIQPVDDHDLAAIESEVAAIEKPESSVNCCLEWNKGNHFKESDLRTAKAFAWIKNRK